MPFDLTIPPVFIGASLVLLVTPGPAVLFVVARSIDHGRRAGVISSLGLGVGNVVHVVAVTVGLSALLVSSALAYTTLKYAGAAYLVYLGLRKLLTRDDASLPETAPASGTPNLFLQGIVVNVLNPKVALFFLAFLPQFVDPNGAHPARQLALLGLSFVLLGIVTDIAYALLAGTAGDWLKRAPAFLRLQRYVTGSVYIGLGLLTAVADVGGAPRRSGA